MKLEKLSGCGIGACPAVYSDGEAYFVVGEQVEHADVEIAPDEALVKVPKEIIDKVI